VTDPRPWTFAALFGALWGAVELTLGTTLMLARVPLSGVLMGLIGLLCLVTLRRLQPVPGVCLLAGAVALFLKVFTIGGLHPGPLIGIGLDALVVEAVLTLTGGRRFGVVVSGALVAAVAPLQLLLMLWLFAGGEVLQAYLRPLQAALSSVGLGGLSSTGIVTVVIGLVAAVGAVGGLWVWTVSERVVRRLGDGS
jgi:hypothetical protein